MTFARCHVRNAAGFADLPLDLINMVTPPHAFHRPTAACRPRVVATPLPTCSSQGSTMQYHLSIGVPQCFKIRKSRSKVEFSMSANMVDLCWITERTVWGD